MRASDKSGAGRECMRRVDARRECVESTGMG